MPIMVSSRFAWALSLSVVLILCLSSVATAETEDQTQTLTTAYTGQQYFRFSMASPAVANSSGSGGGNGSAELQVDGTMVTVHLQAEGTERSARLTLLLVANGTTHSIANMTSSYDGEVESEATLSLGPGSYLVGLEVLDASNPSAPVLVLVSIPATEMMSLSQASGQSTVQSNDQSRSVNTVYGGTSEDDGIHNAIQTKVISAVVDVGESGSFAYATDHNFSVSVGRYQQHGYLISVFAANVIGPRVLLVNLTSPSVRSLFSNAVLITLDGGQVQQANSLSQVLGASAGSPAQFVVVSTAAGLQLLVSIPHFSFHVVEILPIIAQAAGALAVDLPVLVVGVSSVLVAAVLIFARRTRVTA
jgi:hypothetical protein